MIDENRLTAYLAGLEAQQPDTVVAAFAYLAGHRVVIARFPDEEAPDGWGYRILKGSATLQAVPDLAALRQLRIGAMTFRSDEEASTFARLHATVLRR